MKICDLFESTPFDPVDDEPHDHLPTVYTWQFDKATNELNQMIIDGIINSHSPEPGWHSLEGFVQGLAIKDTPENQKNIARAERLIKRRDRAMQSFLSSETTYFNEDTKTRELNFIDDRLIALKKRMEMVTKLYRPSVITGFNARKTPLLFNAQEITAFHLLISDMVFICTYNSVMLYTPKQHVDFAPFVRLKSQQEQMTRLEQRRKALLDFN